MVQHDIWRYRKKKFPARTILSILWLRSRTIHHSVSVGCPHIPTPPPSMESPPRSQLQNRDPFLDLHHQLTLFPSWVASSTAQPESVRLSGWGHYSARICTEVLLKPRLSFRAPRPAPVTYFYFLYIAAITTSQRAPRMPRSAWGRLQEGNAVPETETPQGKHVSY